ncbi:peptidoglycan-binding domain-containing protein [Profundibacter sp.]
MVNRDVKIWQKALRDGGLYSGLIDGDFGAGTRRASFELMNRRHNDPTIVGGPTATLVMVNQNAIRNKPITDNLKRKLIKAVTDVYGAGCRIDVYSGGQDRKGHGKRRTGSVRHDDYGHGGRAADCYIYLRGRKVFGKELAWLGQHWLAAGYGGCGLEMATGGIHLDEWTTPPAGGGMFWTYKYSDSKPWGATVRRMLEAGARGEFPK